MSIRNHRQSRRQSTGKGVEMDSSKTNRLGLSKQDYTVRDTQTDGTEIVYSGIVHPAVSRIGMSGFVATIRVASDTFIRKGHERGMILLPLFKR